MKNSKDATASGKPFPTRQFFLFFLVSGFCSILYELIWLRLSMARFGVTTATVSIVLSCFMAGLGVGSWLGGKYLPRLAKRFNQPALRMYAFVELLIGCSAILFPLELWLAETVLSRFGSSLSLSSGGYYLISSILLASTFVPWCALMGATIPLGMFAIRARFPERSQRSFSLLYLANVAGAVLGALLPLLVVEIRGFSGALLLGMLLNFSIAAAALRLQRLESAATAPPVLDEPRSPESPWNSALRNRDLWLLFLTGLASMAMEVVWIRLYTIFIGTFVYSFAAILSVYLASTFLGSSAYRLVKPSLDRHRSIVWVIVWLAALVPVFTADQRIPLAAWLRVPLGISLFSGLLGYVTPLLVDRVSRGDSTRAGRAYAVNVTGCIVGPLIAGFLLLPNFSERDSLLLLSAPLLIAGLAFFLLERVASRPRRVARLAGLLAILGAYVVLVSLTQSYVEQIRGGEVRRDSTATVVAAGEGPLRRLYVNGISMTVLTPITKIMSALPLAFLDRPPQNALTICFGMGTTHRSMLSWGIDSTVVELVPSVPQLFGYFHEDAQRVLAMPTSHVIIDDGRRFLERTSDLYDVIVIDPPPPIGAAGSSLLYSKEFYALASKHLRPDGILQQWYPGGDNTTTAAVARAIKESFPHVRAFGSISGWGIHYLASAQPIADVPASVLATRMPPEAARDLVEWGPYDTPERQFDAVLQAELPVDSIVQLDRITPPIRDDRPINEYDWLRNHFRSK